MLRFEKPCCMMKTSMRLLLLCALVCLLASPSRVMAEEDAPNDEQPEGEPEKIEDGGSSGGSGGEGPDVIHQTVTGGVQPPVCRCDKALIPVCGANGIVYGNVCLAKCAKQKMTFACKALDRATCQKVCFIDSVKACRKACAGRPPKPACAADGKVYRNPCLLKCDKLKLLFHCTPAMSSKTCANVCKRKAGQTLVPL